MMYQTDYLISWDFRDGDLPTVVFSKMYAKKESPHLMCDVLGRSYGRSGVVSLRQLIEGSKQQDEEKEKDNG